MIAFIRGIVNSVDGETIVIDKGGVGLEICVPMSMLQPAPAVGEEITLHTHLQVKEDGWQLFGFADKEQLRIFRLLIGISGIGAKTGVAILDKIAVGRFPQIIAAQDHKPLTAVSGVGKKTAERILLELKDKFPLVDSELPGPDTGEVLPGEAIDPQLLAALKQLGYTATESRAFALKAMANLGADAASEALLRESLKIAMRS